MNINSYIGTRLLRLVFGLYFLVTVAVTSIQLFGEYLHVKSKIKEEIKNYQLTFKPGIDKSLWSYDIDQLESIILGMKEISTIVGVEITDVNLKVLATTGETSKNTKEGSLKSLYDYNFPIKHVEDDGVESIIGYCTIFSDNLVIIERVKYGFLLIIVNSLIKTAALWGIILYFVRKIVANPLNALTEVTKGVDINRPETYRFNENTKLGLTGRQDEIGQLSRSFFAMGEAILQKVEYIGRANDEINSLNRNLENRVEYRTKEITILLNSLKQGLFAIGTESLVQTEYSRYLEDIFETHHIAGRNGVEFLFDHSDLTSEKRSLVNNFIEHVIGEDILQYEVNEGCLPLRIIKRINGKHKFLELDWVPVESKDGCIEKILASVKDVTELRQTQQIVRQQEVELHRIGRVIAVPTRKFDLFMHSSKGALNESISLIRNGTLEEIDAGWVKMLLNIHTIKGNSRTYGFDDISSDTHEAESLLFKIQNFSEDLRQPCVAVLSQVRSTLEIIEKISDEKLGRSELAKFERVMLQMNQLASELKSHGVANHIHENYQDLFAGIAAFSQVSFVKTIEPIMASLPRLALQLNKPCPEFHISGDDFLIGKENEGAVEGAFVHILRNSIDYGMEAVNTGAIYLKLGYEPGFNTIRYEDSGRGLDLNTLFAIGLEKSILAVDASDVEIAELIFATGISSSRQVTNISGRGVGMGAVRQLLESIGGSIDLRLLPGSEPFRKFSFMLRVPIIRGTEKAQNSVLGHLS